jgi:cholest-4-en-3-one 26-monooxygenase
VCLFYP